MGRDTSQAVSERPPGGHEAGATPETAAVEVGHALSKVLSAYRFYAEGHASLVEFQQKLWESLRQYHAVTGGPAVLHVSSTALLLGELPLVETKSPKDSVTRPLFLEGVQQILLQPGVEVVELGAFFGLWNRALQRSLPPEYDFYTCFWERGFEDIELVVAEVPSTLDANAEGAKDEALLAEREEQLFHELTRRGAGSGGRRLSVGHDEWLARLEAEVLTPVSAQDLARTGAPAFPGLGDAEVAELRAALQRPGEELLERGLRVVWGLLAVCREEERAELLGWAEELLAGLVSQGRWTELQQSLQGMIRDARASPGRAEDLFALTRLFMKEGVRFALATATGQPGGLVHVMALLDALPRDALRGAPQLLLELTATEARAALARLLVRRGVSLSLLVTRASALKPEDLTWVQPLREQGPEAQPLTAALLAHPAQAVRSAVLAKFGPREVEVHRVALLKMVGDEAPAVRQAVLALLVRHRVAAAVDRVVARLQGPVDDTERKALLRALAELGGPVAAATLRATFERVQDTDLKAHCARCIGLLGDPRARPLLEAVAKKLLAPRVLREACREALTQLAPVG